MSDQLVKGKGTEDVMELEDYVRERLEQKYEVLPLRQAAIIECSFCVEEATHTDETDDGNIVRLCDGCEEKAKASLAAMWEDIDE